MTKSVATIAILTLAACARAPDTANETNAAVAAPEGNVPAPAENFPAPVEVPAPGTAGGLPDDRTPLEEPRGAIDPKSAEAAGQVVQHYGALIEQKRFAEAETLWGDAGAAKAMSQDLKAYTQAHLQVGKPFDMEGAAGSSYISVPVSLYGKLQSDAIRNRAGTAILRRVNDVPGSTEAQRRWHIERIEWKA
jgi:hypothetical protein